MKFKEFVNWCNERSCDGCWGAKEALICIQVLQIIYKQLFWKREKIWKSYYEKPVTKEIIEPINQKIKNYMEK